MLQRGVEPTPTSFAYSRARPMTTNGQVLGAEVVTKAQPDLSEIGSTGLVQYHGVLAEEWNRSLQGDREIAVYKEMGDDPVIGGVLLAIDNLMRQVEWEWEPSDHPLIDRGQAMKWRDFAETCMGDMSHSWADFTSARGSKVQFGWSYHSVSLKRRNGEQPDRKGAAPSSDYDDGLCGWRRIPIRSQDSLYRWEFDPDTGALTGMWQQVQGEAGRGGPVFLPLGRSALFRTQAYKDSPQGRSVLRSAYTPWREKQRIRELRGIGIERDLAGLPVVKVPRAWATDQATADQKRALRAYQTLATNIRRNTNEGVILPTEYDDKGHALPELSLLSSGGRRQFDIEATLNQLNTEMAMSALADWLMLGHGESGSRALAEPKVDIFSTALETWLKGDAEVMNAHVTPRLMLANGVSRRYTPRLRPGRVQQVDMNRFSEAIAKLVSSTAITPDLATENYTRRMTGLPAKEEAAA